MSDSTVARVAALRTASFNDLKQLWRELFQKDPPPFNRRYIETRLAYRIQELALGGLKRETVKRLEKLGEQLDGGKQAVRKRRTDGRPIAGILDEIFIKLPTPPFTPEEKKLVADNVYAHVWQQAMSGGFARAA